MTSIILGVCFKESSLYTIANFAAIMLFFLQILDFSQQEKASGQIARKLGASCALFIRRLTGSNTPASTSGSYTPTGTGERLSPWIRVTNLQMGLKPHLKVSLLYNESLKNKII
ncbi:hypothetical protein SATMO3_52950 [Sporomusa aerivorans]